MLRTLLASEWTAAAVGVVLVVLHAWWFRDSQYQSEVITGFGGALTTLGVYVAAQPSIRIGIVEMARQQVGLYDEAARETEKIEREAVRLVLKERIVGVAFIALGSLLNGYGPAIARLFALRGV